MIQDRKQANEADFARMLVYLRNIDSTWCYALYDDVYTRNQLIERLRQELAPLPVLERSLAGLGTDNALEVLRQIPIREKTPAPVVCFIDIYNAIFQGSLTQALDFQRELFAEQPHRLVFWMRDAEWRELYRRAPNFSSRTNGTFDFQHSPPPESHYQPVDVRPDPAKLEEQKTAKRRVENYKQRLQLLSEQTPTDDLEIARTLMELGEELKKLDGNHWAELEGIYVKAERHFAVFQDKTKQAKALYEAGRAAYFGGIPTALVHSTKALEFFRSAEDRLGEAQTLEAIGAVLRYQDKPDLAIDTYQSALELYRAIPNKLGEAHTLKAIGDVFEFRKNSNQAFENYEAALEIFHSIGNSLGEATTFRAIGHVFRFRKKFDQALKSYQNALFLSRAVRDRHGEANTLRSIGEILQLRNEFDLALENYQTALALSRAVGDRVGEANSLRAIGGILQLRNEFDLAFEIYQTALALSRAVGDRIGEANILSNMANLLVVTDPDNAAVLFEKTQILHKSIQDKYLIAAHIGNFGMAYWNSGKVQQAKPYLLEAATLFDVINLSDEAKRYRDLANNP